MKEEDKAPLTSRERFDLIWQEYKSKCSHENWLKARELFVILEDQCDQLLYMEKILKALKKSVKEVNPYCKKKFPGLDQRLQKELKLVQALHTKITKENKKVGKEFDKLLGLDWND